MNLIGGCGYFRPDTRANHAVYRYAGGQKPACGFPTVKVVGLFSLATGDLMRCACGSWKPHEVPLAWHLVGWMHPGELVMHLYQARAEGRGKTSWHRSQKTQTWDRALWNELPRQLAVRLVCFQLLTPRFRTETVTSRWSRRSSMKRRIPNAALAELYGKRGNFRDLKTTLGLDVLRTQSPALIDREILIQGIAYNLVRALIIEASRTHAVPIRQKLP